MTRDEFKSFVEKTIEDILLFSEKHVGEKLSRKIAFQWMGQNTGPNLENISDIITNRVYIDAEHIYPCVDIGVSEILPDDTVLLVAKIAGYPPAPFQRNRKGFKGPFTYIFGKKFLDKYNKWPTNLEA